MGQKSTDTNKLYHGFLKEISEGPASVSRFFEAVGSVAYYYHIYGIEAEYIGDFRLPERQRNLMLYQREEGMPAGEPASYTFHLDQKKTLVIYIYPLGQPFTDDEKEQLEIYATDAMFYLARLRLDDKESKHANLSQTTGLPNASGYLHEISELMKKGISLKNYCAFYFNLKGFGDINKTYGREKGDDILWQYASFLGDFIGNDEVLGHLGG
ncbi:MAG: diguanylate cyclase, partial [Lachnospiraceae bacterium]|nr:diguanylate cyclase [Lachnospiraceae bacterium]